MATLIEIDLTDVTKKTDLELDADMIKIKRLMKQAAHNGGYEEVMLTADLLEIVLREKVKREQKDK